MLLIRTNPERERETPVVTAGGCRREEHRERALGGEHLKGPWRGALRGAAKEGTDRAVWGEHREGLQGGALGETMAGTTVRGAGGSSEREHVGRGAPRRAAGEQGEH